MELLALALAALAAAAPSSQLATIQPQRASCLSGWIESTGVCLKAYHATNLQQPFTFDKANAKCQAEGAQLARLESLEVTSGLSDLFGKETRMVVGLRREQQGKNVSKWHSNNESIWRWADGSPLNAWATAFESSTHAPRDDGGEFSFSLSARRRRRL